MVSQGDILHYGFVGVGEKTDNPPVLIGSVADVGNPVYLTATPIPAALPLFVSALGGLGFVGWRRRKTQAA